MGQAFGRRVDGRQGGGYRRGLQAVQVLHFRMVDLQPGSAGAHFAIAAPPTAALQVGLEGGGEVVEAQAQGTAAILDTAQQTAPPPHHHIRAQYHALDDRVHAWTQGADRCHPGTVLVAQRQMEQHVLHTAQAEPAQLVRQRRADALEYRQRGAFQLQRHGVIRPGACQRDRRPNTGGSSR